MIYFAHSLYTKVTDYIYVVYSFANLFTQGPNSDALRVGIEFSSRVQLPDEAV